MTRPTLDHITIRNTDVGHLFYCTHCRKGESSMNDIVAADPRFLLGPGGDTPAP